MNPGPRRRGTLVQRTKAETPGGALRAGHTRGFFLGAVLLLSGCSAFTDELCEREQQVNTALADAAGYLGPIGDLVATVLNVGLGVICESVKVTGVVLEAGPKAVGIMPAAAPVPEPPDGDV